MTLPESPVTLIKDIRPGLRQLTSDFIVLDIYPTTKTKEGKDITTLKVADATGSINIVLFGEYAAAIQPSDVLRMTSAYSVVNKGSMLLYMARNGSITKIGEFCFLFSEVPNLSEPNSDFVIEYLQQQQQQQNGRGNSPPNLEGNAPSGEHGFPGQQRNFVSGVPSSHHSSAFDHAQSASSPVPDPQIPSTSSRITGGQSATFTTAPITSSGPVDPRASRGGQNRYHPYQHQQSQQSRAPLQPIGAPPGGLKTHHQSQVRSFSNSRSNGGPPVIPANPVVSFRSGPSQHSASVRR